MNFKVAAYGVRTRWKEIELEVTKSRTDVLHLDSRVTYGITDGTARSFFEQRKSSNNPA